MDPDATNRKIELRILAELQKGAPTMREAAERAAYKAAQEVKDHPRWTPGTIFAMTTRFAEVAVAMAAEVAAQNRENR